VTGVVFRAVTQRVGQSHSVSGFLLPRPRRILAGESVAEAATGVAVRRGWECAINDYAVWLSASGARPQTVRLRRYQLQRLANTAPHGPWATTTDDLVAWLSTPTWQPETRKSARSAVRQFYAWATRTGRVERNPAVDLPSVHVPPGKPRPTPVPVINEALARADDRGRLMVLLALLAGLRRGEIAALHSRDVVTTEAGPSLRITGKAGKVRVVPLRPDLAQLIPLDPPGWVFPGRDHGHISPGHVGVILTRLLGPGWSGHTLRHRFGTTAYESSHDLRAVQLLLGHSKPETTARYTLVEDAQLRQVVLGLPQASMGGRIVSFARKLRRAATV
jgi:integrase/recombinase XerC